MLKKPVVKNDIHLDDNSVWKLSDSEFNYSDGVCSEKYLTYAITQAKDISSNSYELQDWIIDWPSEYHLTNKRAQLLNGFVFDKESSVLEVGCGCGAITRFLGETFTEVTSIEGSIERAKIARLRTRDLNNVSILCAPFQDIEFDEKYDLIFCIGVFEYSGSFFNSNTPYHEALDVFKKLLKPNGTLVIAIENKLGLKYFSSCTEDHTNRMFEGIEGYPIYGKNVCTFGKIEIKNLLQEYFPSVKFYHPYPDYKLTECVISEDFFKIANLAELTSAYKSRDYSAPKKELFNELFASVEIQKEKILDYFSNSFLIFAGNIENIKNKEQLGYFYTKNRLSLYQTKTIFTQDDNKITSKKITLASTDERKEKLFSQKGILVEEWQNTLSLHYIISKKIYSKGTSIEEILQPCKIWLDSLRKISFKKNNQNYINGQYLDVTWKNSYISDKQCKWIDQEWIWNDDLKLNTVIIRSIYYFLAELKNTQTANSIFRQTPRASIIKIATELGVDIYPEDFNDFIEIESHFHAAVTNQNKKTEKIKIIMFLKYPFMFHALKTIKTKYLLAISLKRRIKCLIIDKISGRVFN